ncbi:WW domain-binding protein 2-like [Dreissena polymorpha]|uniref:GRAM domain-containing protein n=1 Tax=Dreissena polymorpha TaxID=45954 RepID=A0A9D4M4V3_DREPO|nr:WW domain-binding protein 2-like [Dreissena polymorpha]XP_052265460.1 WW domain-binding protein 2-like [Dreissena polymorpha]KAH3869202.1 hypothetical protein DPMN_032363 [Dreissena polymorpha]
MSINTAHANGGVLIFTGERILLYCDGVEMGFEPSSVPHFKGNKTGTLYLTTHRVIFCNKSTKEMMQSFSLPFLQMRGVELEQPVFGANYIKGKMIAEPGGNWTGEGKFKMWFKSGGAIEFGQAMLQAGKLASRNRPAQPPAYTPPQGPFYQAPPPAYSAPHTDYYAWVPYQTFPNAPPPEYVYTMNAPPPYPGVDPAYPPPQAMGGVMSSADAKAMEAAGNGYYNPANPHQVYTPAQYPSAPPAYDEVTKKHQ